MKSYFTNILGKFFNGIIFGTGVVIVLGTYSVYSAYTSISSVSNGDKLTSSTFNNLISNIDDLNTRIASIISTWSKTGNNLYYTTGNIGIGTNNPQATLDVSGTVKFFGNRTNIVLGTIYHAPTDGFVLAFGRTDGASGLLPLTLMGGGTNPPTSELGVAYSYNNGTTYFGNFQLTIPVKKGEYYQLLCNGLTSCPTPYLIGNYSAYFLPMGN